MRVSTYNDIKCHGKVFNFGHLFVHVLLTAIVNGSCLIH